MIRSAANVMARPKLLELTAALDREGVFTDVFMISALNGEGTQDLLEHLAARVPAGDVRQCLRRLGQGRHAVQLRPQLLELVEAGLAHEPLTLLEGGDDLRVLGQQAIAPERVERALHAAEPEHGGFGDDLEGQ